MLWKSPFAIPSPSRRRTDAAALAAIASLLLLQAPAEASDAITLAPPTQDEAVKTVHSETAILAGGCFWGVQGVFQHVKGVQRAVSGYAGGTADTAHYETVAGGSTGHAESVQITFDPTQVTYGTLLRIFFSVVHDPTQLDRQEPDSGKQYRSAIFPQTAEQEQVARAYIAQVEGAQSFAKPVVTRIETGASFYPAEDYHQDFLSRNPTYPYIAIYDQPKITDLKRLFPAIYSEKPVLVSAAGK